MTLARPHIAPLAPPTRRSAAGPLLAGALLFGALVVTSIFVGVSDVTPWTLFGDGSEARAAQVLVISRTPRTIAIVLTGAALAIAGTIMQLLARNRFVEPSTAGTVESASLGLVVVALVAPGLPLMARMLVATCFALSGTVLFLAILRRIPLRDVLLVPLVGMMLGGVISSVASFLAYRHDLMQSLGAWTTGDFSAVLRGRYELLWLVGALALVAYVAADRFTVAGLGEAFTTNLGLAYRRVLALGLTIVATVTAVIVVTVGAIPFVGLIVPNVMSMLLGDNLRRSLPWVALGGASFTLACDIVGRLVRQPFEVPIGTIMGIVGALLFLVLLLRSPRHG